MRCISVTKGMSPNLISLGQLLSPPTVSKPVSFYITPTTSVPKVEQVDAWLAFYFWVDTTDTMKDANVEVIHVSEVVNGHTISLPVLRNTRTIDRHELIRLPSTGAKVKAEKALVAKRAKAEAEEAAARVASAAKAAPAAKAQLATCSVQSSSNASVKREGEGKRNVLMARVVPLAKRPRRG